MIDTIIVSGGNIHSDFALDFLKKNEACLIAADKGLEFFLEHQLLPDAVIGDFDSLSEDGKKFLEIYEERSMDSEIPYGGMTEWKLQKGFGNEKKEIKVIRLRPEKDDSDTQSAMNYAIRTGAKYVSFFPLGGDVTGLTLEGFKYSLDHYRLTTADSGLTVSNEIVSEKAKVTYQSGTLLMIMSRD